MANANVSAASWIMYSASGYKYKSATWYSKSVYERQDLNHSQLHNIKYTDIPIDINIDDCK